MTFQLKTIRDAIFDWVRDYSLSNCFPSLVENHILWADQDGHQPKPPYIALKIISGPTKIGSMDEMFMDETTNTLKVDGLRTITLNIEVFGSDALEITTRLEASLQFPQVAEYFRARDMSAYDNSGITDVTELLETIYEQRASMDVFFYVPYEFETNLEKIGRAHV